MIRGHNVKVFRTRIDEGYRLGALCKCGHRITGITNYEDLNALIRDHYRDIAKQREDAQQEAKHS